MTFVTITSAAFMTPAPSLTRGLYCADRSISLICIKTANPLPWLVQVGIARVTLEYGTWVERASGWWR